MRSKMRMMCKFKPLLFLSIFVFCLLGLKQETMSHPTQIEWQEFRSLPQNLKNKLWQDHYSRGRKLKDWAWTWRFAWLSSCAKQPFAKCGEILSQGLYDDAVVIRAHAAKLMGFFYQDSKHKGAVRYLAKAFQLKANYRAKQPLYIQERILYALYLIGGSYAHNVAEKLSKVTPPTSQYWNKLKSN